MDDEDSILQMEKMSLSKKDGKKSKKRVVNNGNEKKYLD